MMPASFLVDTDWVIDHFNAVGAVTRRLQALRPRGLALSIISVAELWEGVHFSRDRARSEAVAIDLVLYFNHDKPRSRENRSILAAGIIKKNLNPAKEESP